MLFEVPQCSELRRKPKRKAAGTEKALDNRPIGFQIKGVAAIIRKLGLDGLAVKSEADA